MLIEKPRLPLRQIILHGWLPSPLKKVLYRIKGYRIGRDVKLGFGSVVCGASVVIGDGTELGLLTIVRGSSIRIGAHVQIGAMTILDTPHLDIGDGTRINEQVFIGGLQFPDSRLTIGRNCQIMQMSFINPARSITIGDDTGIGGHCLLFGHTSWLSKFEGYPVDFQPIVIGSSVSLAWRVFVLPGTRIGDGSVVGANSLVNGTIPARSMAVGFPARVVSHEPDFPRQVSAADKERFLGDIVAEMLAFFEGSGLSCRGEGLTYHITQQPRGWWSSSKAWRLVVRPDAVSETESFDADVLLSLRAIPSSVRMALVNQGSMWIDIESKERSDSGNDRGDEVAQYLRRYGVRLFRVKANLNPETSLQTCAASRVS